MSLAANAYKIWKQQHTVNLRVYTDEQMFEIGFEQGRRIGMQQAIEEIEQKPISKKKKSEKV